MTICQVSAGQHSISSSFQKKIFIMSAMENVEEVWSLTAAKVPDTLKITG
jgi:hypothetical protein